MIMFNFFLYYYLFKMLLSSLIEKRKNYVRGDKVVINYLNVSDIGRSNKF